MPKSFEIIRKEKSSKPTRRRGTREEQLDHHPFLHWHADCLLTISSRQALRYIIRNTSLPPRMRAEAQLQLSQMHCYTRSTQIKNRCIVGGKGRGVLRDFKMARVCLGSYHRLPGNQYYSYKSTFLRRAYY
jgi:ribosomal protein S14